MAPAHDGCNFEITSRWEEILEWCPMPSPTSPVSTSASGALVRHALSCPSTPLPQSRASSTSGQSAVTPSAAAQSGRFSETTKTQVKAIYDGSKRCWVCRGGMADCAHVLAMEDDQTDRWDKAGLIPPGTNLKNS
ncbi:hypothetical protein N7519_006246 [Penicillium mononematosum]|uniref:uncharacterized protein n=1 Tax=Penicillium mononematosum TaxID=268346 RepID=UPI002547C07A|nr:uncharacterized protein N7519_006246 [Penicillium mononematosum]KAJ6184945.1 hypothetical protein N7519_006246 [Penicillium mononematosum]